LALARTTAARGSGVNGIGPAAAVFVAWLSGRLGLGGRRSGEGPGGVHHRVICTALRRASPKKLGPDLHGRFDQETGKRANVNCSATVKWNDEELDKWLTNP
jgi:cytochrome c2